MPHLRGALGLTVMLAGLLFSGCGSGGTGTATAPASASHALSTRAHFTEQAEAVCRTLSQEAKPLRARQESLRGLPAAAAAGAFVSLARESVAISQAAEGKLRALPRPPADAHAIEQLLRTFSGEVTDATAIARAAANQESALGEAAEGALKKSAQNNIGLADEYGMRLCIASE